MKRYKTKYNLHTICYFDFVSKSIHLNFYSHTILGRTILEQRGAQTAARTRARAQATTAGTNAATAAAAAVATNQRSTDMRTYRGQRVEEAVKHRGAQSQENGA